MKTPLERTRRSWYDMKLRCLEPKTRCYKWYGGRGITICKRWMTFENFLADMGLKPDGMSLDRIDNAKHYTPENCRWADRFTQMANSRRTHYITFRGETLLLRQWSERLGIASHTIAKRLKSNWSLEDAMTTPSCRSRYVSPNEKRRIPGARSLP